MAKTTLPRWYVDFMESVYFAFNGSCPNSRVNDPILGEFTPDEVKKEVADGGSGRDSLVNMPRW